jgi:hypothetical protein
MLLFLAKLGISRQLESLTQKYKTRLEENTSVANDELIVIWVVKLISQSQGRS